MKLDIAILKTDIAWIRGEVKKHNSKLDSFDTRLWAMMGTLVVGVLLAFISLMLKLYGM